MKKMSRLIAILTSLQSRSVLTAQQMAHHYEVSIRTIYRDIKSLEEAGLPIGTEAGGGYFLTDGYRLPPLMISEMEAFSILSAEKIIRRQGDHSLQQEFHSLSEKVRALLPPSQRAQMQVLDAKIAPSSPLSGPESSTLSRIEKAIGDLKCLDLKYRSSSGAYSERRINPLALYFTVDSWIVVAWCHVREEEREFRLDRIIELSDSDTHFSLQLFSLDRYFQNKSNP